MPYTGPHNQLNQVVLSDTLNEWREKSNQHVDILNNLKIYDVVAGDGITFSRTGGSVTLEIAPNLSDGITIAGDLVVQGNITFTGTAAQFDTTVFTVDDHQIELGASGSNNAAGANDAGVNDGGIILKSTQGDKKWTWLNSIAGHQSWFTSEHLGISSGKAIFGEDNFVRFHNSDSNGMHIEFRADQSSSRVADLSYATGATGAIYNNAFGNGTGTGGIRMRQDGTVEILKGVNRIVVDQESHGFVHGEVVRWDGTNYVKAQANSEANAEIMGVVDRYGMFNSNQFVLVTHGEIKGFSAGAGEGGNEGIKLTSGEIHFLDPDTAGNLVIQRPSSKGQVVKPVLMSLSEEVGYVVNYIGGLVPDQDIVANSVPQTWRIIGDGSNSLFGLSGSNSSIAGSHIVSINGVMQIPENDGGTIGAGTGITFGVTGGTGPASFRIVEGVGGFTGMGNGNRIEFVEPPVSGAEIVVVNQSLTKPFEAIKETYLRSTGTTEQRLLVNRLGDYVSVKDYGAVGDGTTDDTTAIQRAINQTETNADQNKRKIFFPTGTYLISSPLQLERHNVFLYGEGSVFDGAPDASRSNNKLSTIKMNAGMTGPAIQFDFSSTVGETDDYVGGFKMEDMVVWASEGTTGTDGNPCPIIDMSGCWVSELNRIATYGHTGITSACGVRLHGFYNNQITDSMIGRYSANGIEIHGASAGMVGTGFAPGTRPSFGIRLHGNLIGFTRVGLDNAAIRVEGGTYGVWNLSIEDNVLYSSDYGVYLAGSNENVIVKNNAYAFRNGGNGLYGSVRCTAGITSDGLTRNLIEFGNTGSQYGNTGDAFFAASATDKRIEMNDGSVLAVNTPKVIALFDATGSLIGGTGSGGTGTNYNVNHITRHSVGEFTVHFVNNLQTDNYSIQGTVGGTAGFVAGFDRSAVSESSCRVYTYHADGSLRDPAYTSVTII